MVKPRVIYWFRTDLRLHDSPALQAALDLNPEVLYPIWTWDPHYVYRARVGVNRWQFLIDCQNDLSQSLTKLNAKQKLLLIREAPQTLFPKLFKAWKITHLVFEKDTDAYAKDRDADIISAAEKSAVEVIVKSGRTLWDSDELVRKNEGKPTMSISIVQTLGPKIGKVPRPIPAPTSLPDPGDTNLDFEQVLPEQTPDLNQPARENGPDKSYSQLAGPKNDFAVPTLAELGFPPATTPHRGGETIALSTLASLLSNPKYIATFEKPKTAPTEFSPQSTTLLSPHLHFGSLGIREYYWRVQDLLSTYPGGKTSQPPVSLIGQLLFRDMYFGAQAALGYKFASTLDNPHCRFIPWHLRSPVPESRLTSPQTREEKWLYRWKYGLTGFPFIDALMRQLRQEGWIHHLGRHAVACFLTRGGCYISWERGLEVFEEWLLDHETACNVGNWQWLSCTAFYAMYYRMYSPVAFGRGWDKEGAFVKRYVPELRGLGEKWIYEPWKAPVGELRRAGVRVEGDGMGEGNREGNGKEMVYPAPMFDFAERRSICLEAMKTAYKVGLYGDDGRLKTGEWRELFGDGEEGVREGGVDVEGSEDRNKDETVEEDGRGAADRGGEGEGENAERKVKGKRKGGVAKDQGTLDGHFKKMKK
ncbi:hypothetical protein ACMFMF_003863 [Clarireedia jacksonii]